MWIIRPPQTTNLLSMFYWICVEVFTIDFYLQKEQWGASFLSNFSFGSLGDAKAARVKPSLSGRRC